MFYDIPDPNLSDSDNVGEEINGTILANREGKTMTIGDSKPGKQVLESNLASVIIFVNMFDVSYSNFLLSSISLNGNVFQDKDSFKD